MQRQRLHTFGSGTKACWDSATEWLQEMKSQEWKVPEHKNEQGRPRLALLDVNQVVNVIHEFYDITYFNFYE